MNSLFRLASAGLILALAPTFTSAQAPVAKKGIVAALQPFVDSHSLAGAVTLVADKDKVLAVDTVGYMDVAAKKPMRPDALFWIASMSKPITTTAFMMLVDEGKVSLDDPVEKYLPEFKDVRMTPEKGKDPSAIVKPKRAIVIRDILSHTSGLPPKSEVEKPTLDGLPLRDAVKSYATTPLLYQPGTDYRYSNAGINTGGRIIEVVSGIPYEEFLDKRLFQPLGMKDTTFWPNEEQLSRLAKSYKPNAAKNGLEETTIGQLQYPLNDRAKRYPMPAGGLFSTAADCAVFCQMLLNGGELGGKHYLSEKAVKELTHKQTPESVKQPYGLGFSTGGGTFGHGGAYKTNVTVDPKKGLIYVFMVQHTDFPGIGKKNILEAFQKAAEAQFGAATK